MREIRAILMRWCPSFGIGLLAGCLAVQQPGPPRSDPVFGEPREVKVMVDRAKTFTLLREIVWYGPYPPARGVRFPPGLYVVEAEDAAYWYLRASDPIEIRVLEHMKIVRRHYLPGGIMISKRFNAVPAAAYADSDDGWGKVMMLEVGPDFWTMEDKYWKKNF